MRWLHRLYAHLCGYFWLACPSCTAYFGGHEAILDEPYSSMEMINGRHLLVCPNCARERRARAMRWGRT